MKHLLIIILSLSMFTCLNNIDKHDNPNDPLFGQSGDTGACINNIGGCALTTSSSCDFGDTFFLGKSCDEVDPNGACINDGFGCSYKRQSNCASIIYTFVANQTCAQADPPGRCYHVSSGCSIKPDSQCPPYYTFTLNGTCP